MAHQTVQFFPSEERTDATNKRVANRILLSIPDNEFWALRPHLETTELPSHRILHEAHEVLQYAYFPNGIVASTLREMLATAPQLRRHVERFSVLLGLQMAQTAGCNRLHDVEQRLARWLLMAQDRVSSPLLPITHDFLATMLGTDRPSVSLAAGELQKAKVIEYNRGSVKVVNRAELERISCECYGVIQRYTSEM